MFDFEFGEVFEDPAIFERVIDDRQQLARGGDDGLARAATFLDALIEGIQVSRVPFGDEGALHQCRPHQLVAALGDPAAIVGVVGLADFWHDADIGRQLIGALEIIDVADT